MELRFSRHAKNRMRLRSITGAEVDAVVASPLFERLDAKGNRVLIGRPGGRHVKVVLDTRVDPAFVITVGD